MERVCARLQRQARTAGIGRRTRRSNHVGVAAAREANTRTATAAGLSRGTGRVRSSKPSGAGNRTRVRAVRVLTVAVQLDSVGHLAAVFAAVLAEGSAR